MSSWSLCRTLTFLLLFIVSPERSGAQTPYDGWTLVAQNGSTTTYLLDIDQNVLRTWEGAFANAPAAHFLPDGSLLRTALDPNNQFPSGGAAGRIQKLDVNSNVVWDLLWSDADVNQHHDIEIMPNGNILMIAWERKSEAEAIAAGRIGISGDMWPTVLYEITPVGTTDADIVWEWHLWDHLIQDVDPTKDNYGVVADHPELLDINFGTLRNGGDWDHANAVDYNPILDQVAISSPVMNEIYVIDHSTTTAEAAGHTGGLQGMGGDILYRWGNPQVYGRGTAADQVYFGVHGVQWIEPGHPGAGNILTYNNGDREGDLDDYSSVEEIVPPVDVGGSYSLGVGQAFDPPTPVWHYEDPPDFFSRFISNAVRLPNGNTLICEGLAGRIFEVTPAGVVLWEHFAPGPVFAARRYWSSPTALTVAAPAVRLGQNLPNPFNPQTTIHFQTAGDGNVRLDLLDISGRHVVTLLDARRPAGSHRVVWAGRDARGHHVASGVYVARLSALGEERTRKLTLIR